MRYYYYPCSKSLEYVSSFIPLVITPNLLTLLGVLTCIPVLLSLHFGMSNVGVAFMALHEFLDYMDGCMARSYKARGIYHNGDFGAFFDSMCDKVFGWSVIFGILYYRNMGFIWILLAITKSLVHVALTVKRVRDYFFPAHVNVDLKAGSFGKFGVTCEDMFLALAMHSHMYLWVHVLSTIFLLMSVDLGLRSLGAKLFPVA